MRWTETLDKESRVCVCDENGPGLFGNLPQTCMVHTIMPGRLMSFIENFDTFTKMSKHALCQLTYPLHIRLHLASAY